MKDTEIEATLDQLMADQRLVRLCELQRTGDEVLDVISLNENQHSDILAWMLDAREGHGQGDEILRDFLVSASTAVQSGESGLRKNSSTARFFADWTPTRIRTSSFGAAFTARELGMRADERVDLFVIDAQNKFILVIENKSGARHTETQLTKYHVSFTDTVKANAQLRSYARVYIALDREFGYDEDAAPPAAGNWLHLGYDWLRTSAVRALMHVDRGNEAARLVVSYCNRQTEWESPEIKQCTDLAAELHQAYPEPVKQLVQLTNRALERDWFAGIRRDQAALFQLQNKGAIKFLRDTRGMATVRSKLLSTIPSILEEDIVHTRAWLEFCPTNWRRFKVSDWWPVTLIVSYSDDARTKYTLSVCWYGTHAKDAAEAAILRTALEGAYSSFKRFKSRNRRRVFIKKNVPLQELMNEIVRANASLAQLHPAEQLAGE